VELGGTLAVRLKDMKPSTEAAFWMARGHLLEPNIAL
jgi:hypothetical protein